MSAAAWAVDLLLIQGALGALDTIAHHELIAALPRRRGAALELRIHGLRSLLYAPLFLGLAWAQWGGPWRIALAALLAVEVALTLWDFVVEDRSRLLPPTERVLHTVLALNGGAILALLLLPDANGQAAAGLVAADYGWKSWAMSALALGVLASGLRDLLASRDLARGASGVQTVHIAEAPQRVLIGGGTGFIGQELVHALLVDGHEPIVVTRDPRAAALLFDGRVRCIASPDELEAGSRVDAVVNLAGARIVGLPWTATRKQTLIESRVASTRALVEWIGRARPKPRGMISASAIGYYGGRDDGRDAAIDEDAAPDRGFQGELCQRWETAARGVEAHGVPLAVLRLGLVFGHQGVLPMMRLPFRFGLGGRIGSGRQRVGWVHIADVLGVIAMLLNETEPRRLAGAYNVVAPETPTQREFARSLAAVCRRPSLLALPGVLLRALLGEQAALLLEGNLARPQRLLRAGYRFLHPALEPALRNLEETPT